MVLDYDYWARGFGYDFLADAAEYPGSGSSYSSCAEGYDVGFFVFGDSEDGFGGVGVAHCS